MVEGQTTGEPGSVEQRWLLLIHQLPTKPAYFRVKIWRRLQGIGAVAVKNTVYALPADAETQEDFEWLLKEIIEGGGEAMVCEARLVGGLSGDLRPDLATPGSCVFFIGTHRHGLRVRGR